MFCVINIASMAHCRVKFWVFDKFFLFIIYLNSSTIGWDWAKSCWQVINKKTPYLNISKGSCLGFCYHTGVIGADLSVLLSENKPLTSRLAVICGTSSCHMAVSFVACEQAHIWGAWVTHVSKQVGNSVSWWGARAARKWGTLPFMALLLTRVIPKRESAHNL